MRSRWNFMLAFNQMQAEYSLCMILKCIELKIDELICIFAIFFITFDFFVNCIKKSDTYIGDNMVIFHSD